MTRVKSTKKKKKRTAAAAPISRQPTQTSTSLAVQDELLAMLGVELWRLEVRAKRIESATALDSYERLMDVFVQIGGRVEDRTGERFIDGQIAEVLHQPPGTDPGSHRLVIAETVRPAVFVRGRCVFVPQVILDREAPTS